jgi:hypothetical protein
MVLSKEKPGSDPIIQFYANTSINQPHLYIFINDDLQELVGGPWLGTNMWTHLAATYNGTILRLYVNGSEVANSSVSGPIQVSDGVLRIGGNSSWGDFFKGRIDEVRIYNRALTVNEIQADMNTPITK